MMPWSARSINWESRHLCGGGTGQNEITVRMKSRSGTLRLTAIGARCEFGRRWNAVPTAATHGRRRSTAVRAAKMAAVPVSACARSINWENGVSPVPWTGHFGCRKPRASNYEPRAANHEPAISSAIGANLKPFSGAGAPMVSRSIDSCPAKRAAAVVFPVASQSPLPNVGALFPSVRVACWRLSGVLLYAVRRGS